MSEIIRNVFIGYTTRILSDALESLIDSFNGFRVIRKAPLGHSLDELLTSIKDPGILVLELNCPVDDDLHYIHSLRATFPSLKILLISYLSHNGASVKFLESGIDGYILKSSSRQDFYTALMKLNQGENYFCSGITKELLNHSKEDKNKDDDLLTDREKEILKLLVSGRTNSTIASQLGLSENTIKTHRRNIQNKFGVNNLIRMIRYACRSSLLDYGKDLLCKSCPYCIRWHC